MLLFKIKSSYSVSIVDELNIQRTTTVLGSATTQTYETNTSTKPHHIHYHTLPLSLTPGRGAAKTSTGHRATQHLIGGSGGTNGDVGM